MLLLIYTFGVAWSIFFPRRSWVEGTRLQALTPVLEFINPGEFKLKEVCRIFILLISKMLKSMSSMLCPPLLPQLQRMGAPL